MDRDHEENSSDCGEEKKDQDWRQKIDRRNIRPLIDEHGISDDGFDEEVGTTEEHEDGEDHRYPYPPYCVILSHSRSPYLYYCMLFSALFLQVIDVG